MQSPSEKLPFTFHHVSVQVAHHTRWVSLPDATEVENYYAHKEKEERLMGFWTKIWGASLAMSEYLLTYPELIRQKNILEVAAGLALPSLFAAPWAAKITASDYAPMALDNILQSARLNNIKNMEVRHWDITTMPMPVESDIMLISDANYDARLHEFLHALVMEQLQKGKEVVLSTPNRISGMGFLERFMDYCTHRQFYQYSGHEESGVFLLKSR